MAESPEKKVLDVIADSGGAFSEKMLGEEHGGAGMIKRAPNNERMEPPRYECCRFTRRNIDSL